MKTINVIVDRGTLEMLQARVAALESCLKQAKEALKAHHNTQVWQEEDGAYSESELHDQTFAALTSIEQALK